MYVSEKDNIVKGVMKGKILNTGIGYATAAIIDNVTKEAEEDAKVYIMRKDMNKTPDTYGSVITGSSNFSEAGLQNNLEFNVELKDSRDVQFALEKFEDLWAKSVPITEEYIEAVEKKTWLRNDITPYVRQFISFRDQRVTLLFLMQ